MWESRRKRAAGSAENEPLHLIQRPVVLFADDDPVARAIARKVVAEMGFGVVLAADGESALRLAREYKPELIITDALMPKLDGREVALAIKQDFPSTKVVVITSVYKDPRYKHEAYKKFAVDDYLSKPVKPADLRHVVIKHLAQ